MELKEILEQLRQFGTTELCDGMTTFRVLDPAIHRMVTKKKIVGTAFTIDIPAGVSGIIPDALKEIQPGQVLVVDAKSYTRQTCWGDYRSFCALTQKVEGVVIDGAFRDQEGCEEVGVPIFARCTVPRAGGKDLIGKVNVPLMLGDVEVLPGDIIVGDADGVVVVKSEEAESLMEKARKKAAREKKAIDYMKENGKVISLREIPNE